jgi:CheY-like chemotaxis protein
VADDLQHNVLQVLLVEDNDDDIYMVEEAFSQAKLVNIVNVVRDGEEALAYLRREGQYKDAIRPGMVLLDINMPKKNGFEVLRELKADPAICAIPVVMLTTSEREEDIVSSYGSGACTFISKPVDLDKLKQIANQFEMYWALVAKVPSHDDRRIVRFA